MTPRLALPLLPVLVVPLLAACGGDGAAAASGTQVVVGAYPLQLVAERVGGEHVAVTNLTPPGAEPHDLELTPQDVAHVSDADLVLTLPGLQPALDDAAAAEAPDATLDLTGAGRVDLVGGRRSTRARSTRPTTATTTASVDPHFWLDPTRLADAADAVAERLGEVDPEHAADFTAGAEDLRADLEQLDADLAAGLETCDSRDLVTNHAAFGYLADRYDLHQVGISGLSPDTEPNPGTLAEIASYVRDHDVTTVFTETLVAPDTAEAVAAETGASTAVLDPLEGLAEDADGDYLTIMRENLSVLEKGLGCS